MEPVRVSPLEGMMNFLTALSLGKSDREGALSVTLDNGIYIDTCYTSDTGYWETAIERPKKIMLIVEQYPDEAHAKEGHTKWVKLMTEEPYFPLKDIDQWSTGQTEERDKEVIF